MKTIDEWFEAYSESHQNPTNKLIHWLCVPAIMFSIIGMVWSFSPTAVWITMAVTMVFYLMLSLPLSLVMIAVYFLMAAVASVIGDPLLMISVTIFVVSWIFQFVGHKVEGKKPSFFEDVKFLLIGPLWCLGFLFRKANLKY